MKKAPYTPAPPARVCSIAPCSSSSSTQPCRLYRGDVNLSHGHHRVEHAFGRHTIKVGQRLREDARGDLPCPPPVLASTARTFLSTITGKRIQHAVGFFLVIGCKLKREDLVVRELWATVQPEAGDASDGELNCQDILFLAVWIFMSELAQWPYLSLHWLLF